MRFWRFLAKRLLFVVPQLFAVSVIVFFLIRLLPGDPSFMLAGPYATTERVAEVRHVAGLDQPILTQYLAYLGSLARGDFGQSWRTSQPVLLDIQQVSEYDAVETLHILLKYQSDIAKAAKEIGKRHARVP